MSKQEKLILFFIVMAFCVVFAVAIYKDIKGDDTMSIASQNHKDKEAAEMDELQKKLDTFRPRSVLND